MIHQSIKELKKIAKERRVSLKTNATRDEIRVVLGMELEELPDRYNHCKKKKLPQVIIKINVNTGEETKYKSIFELANSLNLFAGSITYRIRTGKSIRNKEGEYVFRIRSEWVQVS